MTYYYYSGHANRIQLQCGNCCKFTYCKTLGKNFDQAMVDNQGYPYMTKSLLQG